MNQGQDSEHADALDVITAHLGVLAPGASLTEIAAAYGWSGAETEKYIARLLDRREIRKGDSAGLFITDSGWTRIEAFMAGLATPLPPRAVFEAEHSQRKITT
jgi:hypothetical protein